MKLGKILCATMLCLVAFALSIASAAETELSDSERMEVIREHMTQLTVGETVLPLTLSMESANPDPAFDPYRKSTAMEHAAKYYAISTLDFDVTFGELIETGFWPYAEAPEGLAADTRLSDFQVISLGSMAGDDMVAPYVDVNSPRWLTNARQDILRNWYAERYSDGLPDLVENSDANPAFWYNEFAARPMQESEAAGDYEMWDTSRFSNKVYGSGSDNMAAAKEGSLVPVINYALDPARMAASE